MTKQARLTRLIVCCVLCGIFSISFVGSDFTIGGTITYLSPRWEDLRFPAILLTIPPGAAPFGTPDLIQFPVGGTTDTYTRCMDDSTDEGLLFTVQTPHGRQDNSNLTPHVHWAPATTDTGTTIWEIECTGLIDLEETVTGTLAVTITDNGDGTANKHQFISNGTFSGASSAVSAITVCSIWRDADTDTMTGDACLLEVDFHYLVDTPGGSSAEITK